MAMMVVVEAVGQRFIIFYYFLLFLLSSFLIWELSVVVISTLCVGVTYKNEPRFSYREAPKNKPNLRGRSTDVRDAQE